jgi:hypothetical protein
MRAFIIFRDRVTYGMRCASAMVAAGLEPVIVDHGSSWPAAVTWLDVLETTGTEVIRRGPGHHPRDLWADRRFHELCGDDRYVVTDCDVIPSEDCPLDWPEYLGGLLDRYNHTKAGLGLRIDRIPENYQWRDKVLGWEKQFWFSPLPNDPDVFVVPIDTTLAMYQSLADHPAFIIGDSLRTNFPYVADHVSWYEDLDNLDLELDYYHRNAEPGISHWTFKDRSNFGPQ